MAHRATFFLAFLLPGLLGASATLHVAPHGDDANPGDVERPLKSPEAALERARRLQPGMPREIVFASGVYHLKTPLMITNADAGTRENPLVLRAESEGAAVLSGGVTLDLRWVREADGQYHAATPPGSHFDQLFADGRRLPMARYPNENPTDKTAAWQGFAADAFSKERASRWSDPAGGFIHAMHVARWGGYHYRITGKNTEGEVNYEGGWQNNRPMGMHPQFRMVENIQEELDAAGEWFHDTKTNQLRLIPLPGMDPAKTEFVGVRLANLVEFRGAPGKPVCHVELRGFTLRHSARTFMETKEPLLRSDWTIHRGGAILLEGTEDVLLADLHLDQPGGNGIFVSGYNRRVTVRGCLVENCGASAVAVVGRPEAVRNPLFRYEQTQDLLATDREGGPKAACYPADLSIEDCLLRGIGRIERQSAGVQISMAARVRIADTTIHDCSRAGINISEGTWGGHMIERVDVFDTVLETHDHGSFNSWGRDRFWHPDRGVTNRAVAARPDLPLLDAVETTVIRHSRWRCDHGWDIDLDDGSSNYEIHHNLMLAGGLKFREGYRRKAWNNILINNGFHPHVWYAESKDRFEKNIIMSPPKPIGMPAGWETAMGSNLLATRSPGTAASLHETGLGGRRGDPVFENPAEGDFRVRDGSPALALGFTNFPMDQFGVKKPSLRAQAATPVIPALRFGGVERELVPLALSWRGSRLVDLQEGQFSAFGTRQEDGGVAVAEVADGSKAARIGLKKNDLIQGINGQRVRNLREFSSLLLAGGEAETNLSIVRNQRPPVPWSAGKEPVIWKSVASEEAPVGITTRGLVIESKPETRNEPLATLLDGRASANYGSVFANGVRDGRYRLTLPASAGALRGLVLVSHNQGGNRGGFVVNLSVSKEADDPGWDPARYTSLGGIDTRSCRSGTFHTLRADFEQPVEARWLMIEIYPLTELLENTSMQEIAPVFGGSR